MLVDSLCACFVVFFCKQKTAYEMRISDWSSDVCSSDLAQVGARVALDRLVEVGELARVADEEHGGVVAHHVPVAFLGVELQREAADVAFGVGRAALAGPGGDAGEHLGFLADLREERRSPEQRREG